MREWERDVRGFHDHSDTPGFDSLLDGEGYLFGDPFLDR
jgi:hypothetical protein